MKLSKSLYLIIWSAAIKEKYCLLQLVGYNLMENAKTVLIYRETHRDHSDQISLRDEEHYIPRHQTCSVRNSEYEYEYEYQVMSTGTSKSTG